MPFPTIKTILPALSHRNFRLFVGGQCISMIGTWMQNIGLAWLVLQLTNSPFLLGLSTAVQFLPVMLFSLFAGPLVDRFPKKRMVMLTQSALMVLALILFVLTETKAIQYWHIIVFSLLLGFINTVDVPTRQSFVIELVGREHLMNAISLNSAVFNVARIAGPAIAGLLIAAFGIGPCFLINAISFIAVIVALKFVDVPPVWTPLPPGKGKLSGVLASAVLGLRYIAGRPILLLPIVLMALISTFVINYSILVPLFTRKELGGDSVQFGLLMTSMGGGSLLAALTLAAWSRKGPRPLVLAVSALGMSFFLMLLGLQSHAVWAAIALGLVGFFSVAFTASCNAHIQIHSDDAMRGRVMSVYALVLGGVTPVGSLYTGQVSDWFGVRVCLILSGAVGLVASSAIGARVLVLRQRRLAAEPIVEDPEL